MLLECASPHPRPTHLRELLHDSIDWSTLLQLAENHGLIMRLAEQLKRLRTPAPPDIDKTLRELQRRYTLITLSLTGELLRLLQHFADLGIDTLVTKGPALSVRCYGTPEMRQYGDLDLIVRGGDMQRVTEAMIALEYAPKVPLAAIKASKFPGEYAFHKQGGNLLVEFHTEETFRYYPRRLPIETVFARHSSVTMDARQIPALAIEDELLLISIHGAKHFWERLMWIADVAALVCSTNAIDWERVRAATEEVGAEQIVKLALRLAMDVAGAALPEQVAAQVLADAKVGRLASQISRRLEAGEARRMSVLERAAFRVKMRGGLWDGLAYLLRLSFSPTEEDWAPGGEIERRRLLDALGRPLRLVRKHGRNSQT